MILLAAIVVLEMVSLHNGVKTDNLALLKKTKWNKWIAILQTCLKKSSLYLREGIIIFILSVHRLRRISHICVI